PVLSKARHLSCSLLTVEALDVYHPRGGHGLVCQDRVWSSSTRPTIKFREKWFFAALDATKSFHDNPTTQLALTGRCRDDRTGGGAPRGGAGGRSLRRVARWCPRCGRSGRLSRRLDRPFPDKPAPAADQRRGAAAASA